MSKVIDEIFNIIQETTVVAGASNRGVESGCPSHNVVPNATVIDWARDRWKQTGMPNYQETFKVD